MLRDDKAFTLVEVLIAMMVLSVGLLELGRMQIVAIQVTSAANRLTQGTNIAQDRIEQLMALPFDHLNLVDISPTDAALWTEYTDPNPPEGFTVVWRVNDQTTTPPTKAVNVFTTWTQFRTTKNVTFSFVKSRSTK
jgi:prepilin-type N-terminal cleavage/methylation domain-containing protein